VTKNVAAMRDITAIALIALFTTGLTTNAKK
jgi:hypothetical protein